MVATSRQWRWAYWLAREFYSAAAQRGSFIAQANMVQRKAGRRAGSRVGRGRVYAHQDKFKTCLWTCTGQTHLGRVLDVTISGEACTCTGAGSGGGDRGAPGSVLVKV